MKPGLLPTKLHPPAAPPKGIRRERLTERLNAGLIAGRSLTLISAPAGFGKSTCVGAWLSQAGRPAAWLSLEAADDDPARFLACFAAAVQSVDANLARELGALPEAGPLPPADTLCALLLNDLARCESPFLLVLDDFQTIQEAAILAFVERLALSRPPQLHLVLVTREDPVLPLARLRANNQLTELRAEDLRFTPAEAADYFAHTMGIDLDPEDLARLDARIEGWVAGLQLAALALQGPLSRQGSAGRSAFIAGLSGTHRHIVSYLTEEVLSRQSAAIQDFLVRSSVLDRMTGELCDAVLERADSGAVLEQMLAANLFLIPLDEDQRWYRYHHLFADLLRSRLSRLPAEQVTHLHRQAAGWLAQAGLAAEAMHHALAGADYPLAVGVLEEHAMSFTQQGHVKTVEGWLRAIPPEWQSQSPRAYLAFASVHLLRGNYAEVARHLALADSAIAHAEQPPGPATAEGQTLRAEWCAIQANLLNVQGQPAQGLEAANRALQLAPPGEFRIRSIAYLALGGAYRLTDDYALLVDAYQKAIQHSRAAGNLLAEMLSANALSLTAIQHGQLRFARQVGAAAVERFERPGALPPPVAGSVFGTVGLVDYEWNDLERARLYYAKSVQLSSLGGHNAGVVLAKVIQARLAQAEGDLALAARLMQEAADQLPFGVPTWLKSEVTAQQVCLYLTQDNPAAAEAALKQFPRSPMDADPRPDEPFFVAYLRFWLYQARAGHVDKPGAQALPVAGQLIAAAGRTQRTGIVLQALLLRAQLHSVQGNPEASLADLTQALQIAQPEGFIRTFVDEGPDMAALLGRLPRQSPLSDYVRKLLAAFPPSGDAEIAPSPRAGLVEPLSDRELEVLGLMSAGLTNPDIAKRLVISLSTVKTHLNNIYGKLNVRNRAEAVLRAKELGVL